MLDPAAQPLRKIDDGGGRAAAHGWSPPSRSSGPQRRSILAGLRGWQPEDLPRLAGTRRRRPSAQQLLRRGELLELAVSPTEHHARAPADVLAELAERVAGVLESIHQPRAAASGRSAAGAGVAVCQRWTTPCCRRPLGGWSENQRLTVTPLGLVLAGHGPQLSRGQQQLLAQLLEWFRAAGLASPSAAECTHRAAKHKDAVPRLLELAAGSRQLVAVAPDYWLHPEVESQARRQVQAALAGGASASLSEIRELLGTTRKYAVPLCEYWDRSGLRSAAAMHGGSSRPLSPRKRPDSLNRLSAINPGVKHETRSTKHETNSNERMTEVSNRLSRFCHSDF